MPEQVLGFRITGAKEAQAAVSALSPAAIRKIKSAANQRAAETENRFNSELRDEYRSAWSTGRIANVKKHVKSADDGVTVQFSIPNYRELEYITAANGGYFQDFPVEPFWIAPVEAKALKIRFPNSMARRFIQGAGGRMFGSVGGGAILVRHPVLWGRRTGGFHRDVITEVAEAEGEEFAADMEEAVANAIVEVTT